MVKTEELTNPNSCLNMALPNELMFNLLGRDEDAPATIRHWVERRIARGKNVATDPTIVEAMQCAELMELQRHDIRVELGKEKLV